MTAHQASAAIRSPIRLAHVVMRTSRIEEMLAWYKLVLNATAAYESPGIAFLCYDEEHHRVAFIQVPELSPPPAGITGVHHVAFTFDSLSTLLENYAQLKERGIEPSWCVNHGPTTSLYYCDPDGNNVEFQVDNYETVEEAGEFLFTDRFDTNPIGTDFDPEELRARLLAGESEESLRQRREIGPRGVETIPIH